MQASLCKYQLFKFKPLMLSNNKHDNVEISASEVSRLMKDVPYANTEWGKSKAQMTGAWVALGAQFGFLFWQLNRIKNNESGTPQLIGNITYHRFPIHLFVVVEQH